MRVVPLNAFYFLFRVTFDNDDDTVFAITTITTIIIIVLVNITNITLSMEQKPLLKIKHQS
jgi:hypothetical protein